MKTAVIGFVDIKLNKKGKVINEDVWKYFVNFTKDKFDNVELMLFNRETLPNLANMTDRLNQFDKLIVAGREPLKYLVMPSEEDLAKEQVFNELKALSERLTIDLDDAKAALDEADDADVAALEDQIQNLSSELAECQVLLQDFEEPVDELENQDDESDESDESEEVESTESDDDSDVDDALFASDLAKDVEVVNRNTTIKSKLEDLRYMGIENKNSNLKFDRVDVIYSLMYYIAKDLINVYHFDILNRTGQNNLVPVLNEVTPHYHHISEFFDRFNTYYLNEEDKGFDFETRGFPFQSNFRILGFCVVTNDYQAYYYFSRDDALYAKEFEEYRERLLNTFEDQSNKFIAFNNKFENNVVLHTLKKKVFFEDARIYTQILKTRGSLKFSANLFLNVPMWNEGIHIFMNHFKSYVQWMNDYAKVYDTSKFSLTSAAIEKDVVQGWIENNDYHSMNTQFKHLGLEFNPGEKIKSKVVSSGSKDNQVHELVVEKYYTGTDLINDPMLFMDEYFDHVNSESGKPFFKFFSSYSDRLEGNFKITNLLKYYSEYLSGRMNEWQACGIGDMGYYCILDGYYTLKLKEMLYDTNYQGVKNGYPYYLSQSNLAGMMEANKPHINRERFDVWKDWNINERLRIAKWIANYPSVVDNVTYEKVGKIFSAKFADEIVNLVRSYSKK